MDALPYVDGQLESPGMRAVVRQLVEEEKRRFRPSRDYLAGLPTVAPSARPAVRAEMDRLAAGQPSVKLDTTRYQVLDPPAHKLKKTEAWREAALNACAQLEHQRLSRVNLEFAVHHAPKAWRLANAASTVLVERTGKQAAAVEERSRAVNRKRKAEQLAAGRKMRALDGEWFDLTVKNRELYAALHAAK